MLAASPCDANGMHRQNKEKDQAMSDSEKQWYVDMQSEIVGPIPLETLRDWLRVKTITPETWVRRDDSQEWHPLAMVGELGLSQAEELGLSQDEMQELEELADQPTANLPLHYLRSDEPLPQLTESDRLRNLRDRAFAVKCIAVAVVLVGMVCIILRMQYLAAFEHAPPAWIILHAGLISIPLLLQYYILDSISVALNSSAELHEKVEALQKKLEAFQNSAP